ncbi:MAG: class I SAM-dependent DNA methyltransferase [Candidimonas sp.]|nr:MAG: class I SAM-dependent DNA methyltransferase [Candidimonas sp.]
MNAVEIEAAVAELAAQPFDAAEFPFAFLAAFGNKAVTIERLRGKHNKSDVEGGVLQRNNIHLAVCAPGRVGVTLDALRKSPKTLEPRARVQFVLATDGDTLEAEDRATGEPLATEFKDLAEHFGFFLPLAGISTVREIKDNPIDVRATGRLNKLYVEILKHNPDWAKRRHDMNHFMARLIFCFFAEDTDIFTGTRLFTRTLDQMTERDGGNVADVMGTLFRVMNTKTANRGADMPNWASRFPYVNGHLFAGATDVPRFTKLARSYLLQAGGLDWKAINPDIFGSMIQAVADDDERGQLGMHYTSVPNILKVLQPLFLDDLHQQMEDAGDSARKLLNLRKRLARIRVFDPACGSGNFLVIAYKRLRAIEAAIDEKRGEPRRKSDIPITNFRGIELRDFAAEIARLALIIAEFQCDVLYRGQQEALQDVLPLKHDNWITQGNALRLDWLTICPPTGTGVKLVADDLFETPLDQAEIDFENEGGETYICGNPPYLGSTWQSEEQKVDLEAVFGSHIKLWRSLDYVAGWFMKAANYATHTPTTAAFVATNSICQGQQVPILWPAIFATGNQITFAHTSFKWHNLAARNAGVTVAIIGISLNPASPRRLFVITDDGTVVEQQCTAINAYLVRGENDIVTRSAKPSSGQAEMAFGNKPVDGGNLLLSTDEVKALHLTPEQYQRYIRRIYGSAEFIRGLQRCCLWIGQEDLNEVRTVPAIAARIESVRTMRLASKKPATIAAAQQPHRFGEVRPDQPHRWSVVMPRTSSESRSYLPVGIMSAGDIASSEIFAAPDAPLWNLALIASRLHLVWIATVCGKLKTDFRYSNTLGWNTFPVPLLTTENKTDLTRAAEDILLARERYFPATIANMYDPARMDKEFPEVRHAHEINDEIIDRIYIGRRFKNDTERLEKLFAMYTAMTAGRQSRNQSAKTRS